MKIYAELRQIVSAESHPLGVTAPSDRWMPQDKEALWARYARMEYEELDQALTNNVQRAVALAGEACTGSG